MNSDLEPTLTQEQVAPPPPPGSQAARRRARARTLFWPGFAAGFLLLSMLTCGGLAAATGLSRIDLEDIQGSATGWTPPSVTATPTPDVANVAPSDSPTGIFAPGAEVRNVTNSRVNIRQTPGHQGKPSSDVIGQVEPGGALQIVAGPAPADNLTWWLIRYQTPDGRSIEGWVAEATQSGVQILGS
jgi:hypothetical protein